MLNITRIPLALKKVLWGLVFFHLFIIALSNYLVQIPVTLFSLHTTWGAISFPFIFLATDLTVRLFGDHLARRIIYVAMLPALFLSYTLSVLFDAGHFQGFSALTELNTLVARIALASFIAYTIGQLLDVQIFQRLRQQKRWWVAPALSTSIGGLIDTALFFSIAFYRSTDSFMATHWPEMAAVDYLFKLVISLVIFVPAYGLFIHAITQRFKAA